MQGISVIKGLLANTRKQYTIRACICSRESQTDTVKPQKNSSEKLEVEAETIQSLDTERITIHYANLDDIQSCIKAVEGAEGAFVITDFYRTNKPQSAYEKEEREERHARTVIDACATSRTVRHLVLSTLESAEDVNNELKDVTLEGGATMVNGGCDGADEVNGANGADGRNDNGNDGSDVFDAKARVAAYARTKKMSVTYVLMPVYSEQFFRAMAEKIRKEQLEAGEKHLNAVEEEPSSTEKQLLVPNPNEDSMADKKVVCMSIDELGPAVANIFDSYEVYAGHDIGLMTDVLSFAEAHEIIRQVFFEGESTVALTKDEKTSVNMSNSSWSSSSLPAFSRHQYRVDIFPKDLGQMFRYLNKTEAVKRRQTVAKTMALVPDAKPFRQWLEENRDNVEFREMLGLR